jgi:hypothetical protein
VLTGRRARQRSPFELVPFRLTESVENDFEFVAILRKT